MVEKGMNGQSETDYRRKYGNLKHKLKFLVYEQECFQEELRKAQRKLLKISRDKSFLLDRLLQYENVDEDSSDSDATASSDNSEAEGPKLLDTPMVKRKRSPQLGGAASPSPSSLSLQPALGFPHSQNSTQSPYLSAMTSPTFGQFPSEYLSSFSNTQPPGGPSTVGATAKCDKVRREKRAKAQKNKKSKLRVPLHSSHPESVTMTFSSSSDPLSALSSKMPPTAILSTVPQQMFSDTGEGSDDDAMDGDDDLVIDIPE